MHASGGASCFSKANLQIMSALSGHLEQLVIEEPILSKIGDVLIFKKGLSSNLKARL